MTRPKDDPKPRGDFRDNTPPERTRSITLPVDVEFEADIKVRPNETPAERSHRLRMEVRRYWFGEGLTNIAAIVIAVTGIVVAVILVFRPSSSVEDKKWAVGVLSHLFLAVTGFAFGKAAK